MTTPTSDINTLSLNDALPICKTRKIRYRDLLKSAVRTPDPFVEVRDGSGVRTADFSRSEEHTSELQSLRHLVCRLLLEKKKKILHACDIVTINYCFLIRISYN